MFFIEPLGKEPSGGGKGWWPMRLATASTGRAMSPVVSEVRVWFVCAPPVWTRIRSGIAFRREQGIVVAHAMGHRFDRADGVFGPGRGRVRSYVRSMPRRRCTDGGSGPRPGPLPQNMAGLPWLVSPMHGDGLPLPESQIGHSPISSRRCPQIHRDRPVATCESGKRVLI
jgi:hypothetical protein